MNDLLVSVSSIAEAEAALAGGADVIDVKDPARGALGRADDDVLRSICTTVGSRRPLSAALGELGDACANPPAPSEVQFLKCGLAELGGDPTWPRRWLRFRESCSATAVVVAYADWRCARAPALDDVVDFACRRSGSVLLIDTCCKDKTRDGRRATLLDWTSLAELESIVAKVRRASGRIALAGSLGVKEIELVRDLRADWIAVRGAACVDGDRAATVDAERVLRIKSLLRRES